jgi:hypothetical protein
VADERARRVQRRITAAGLVVGTLVGVAAVAAWVGEVGWLHARLPGPVSPTAALGVVGLAAAGWVLRGARVPAAPWRLLGGALGVTVTALALAALSAAFGGPGGQLAIFRLLDPGRAAVPLSVPSGLALSLGGLAALASALRIGGWRLRFTLAGVVAATGLAVLLGHLYGATELSAPFGLRMASPTSGLAFLALGVAAASASLPLRWWQLLLSERPAALLLRRLLPIVLAGLAVTGYVRLLGEQVGWIAPSFGVALMVVVNGSIVAGALVATALQLERQQQRADEEEQLVAGYEQLLQRQALELNDEVIQGLSAAWLALDLGHTEEAAIQVRRATEQAQRIARQQLAMGERGGRPRSEQLTRLRASGSDDVSP